MSTQTFKALSIVTNVKQGELIKRLLQENGEIKALRYKLKQMKKYVDDMFMEREHCAMYCCRMCNEKCAWDEIDKNHTCEDCIFDIRFQYYDRDFYEPVHDPEGAVYEEIFIKD